MSDPHEMDKFLGNFRWNDLNPDEQDFIGSALREAVEHGHSQNQENC